MEGKAAVTALLEVYSEAIDRLKILVATLDTHELLAVRDVSSADGHCRSIQTVLTHVVNSGFGYATTIHNRNGAALKRPDKIYHATVSAYLAELDAMVKFTETVFREIYDADLEQAEETQKMLTGWGQRYDIEQLMEHAIVHILRHHRQIRRFLQ